MSEKEKRKRVVAAQSFNVDEVTCLDEIFAAIRGGRDPKLLLRTEVGVNLQRKVVAMKTSVQRQLLERDS